MRLDSALYLPLWLERGQGLNGGGKLFIWSASFSPQLCGVVWSLTNLTSPPGQPRESNETALSLVKIPPDTVFSLVEICTSTYGTNIDAKILICWHPSKGPWGNAFWVLRWYLYSMDLRVPSCPPEPRRCGAGWDSLSLYMRTVTGY